MKLRMSLVLVSLWSSNVVLAARHGMQAFESVRAAPEGWKVEGAPPLESKLEFRISLVPVSARCDVNVSVAFAMRHQR